MTEPNFKMTRKEHLMIRAMEECAELSQRFSKALVFGLDQIQEDANDKPEENPLGLTNRERIVNEFNDLVAVMAMCGFHYVKIVDANKFAAKMDKVERYLERSRRCGTLV